MGSISEHDNMGRDMTQNCIILPFLILTALNTLHLSNARRSRTRTHGSDDFSETTKSDNSGLFIWRIEDFSPVPLNTSEYGKFHNADSYIVLLSKMVDGRIHRDIHLWIGNETSIDEAGNAAILTVMLDHLLGGGAIQHREEQFHESQTFKSYFKKSLEYLPGGVQSGMNYIPTEVIPMKLYLIKGKETVIASQVPLAISSLNMFDCFVLDKGKGRGVFVFRPRGANFYERMKATLFAKSIRDEDHEGKGRVEIFDEAENDEMSRFFDQFGFGSMADINFVEIDDNNNQFQPRLYETRGWQDILIEDPLSQDLLHSNKTFMLTAGPKNIYLWIGRQTSKLERRTANEVAEKFKKDNEYPSSTPIELVLEGLETSSFTQFFPSWDDTKVIEGVNIKLNVKNREKNQDSSIVFLGPDRIDDKPDWNIKTLHRRMEDKIERDVEGYIGFMPKDDEEGLGRKTVWKIENFRLVEVRDLSSYPMYKNKTLPSRNGSKKNGGEMRDKTSAFMMMQGMMQGQVFLHSSYCYVILYKYGPTMKNHIVYFWQGEQSSHDDRAASALQAYRIEQEVSTGRRSSSGFQVRVEQGRESSHFLQIFGGTLVIVRGGKKFLIDESKQKLYQVMQVGQGHDDYRVEQLEPDAVNLNSNFVYILISITVELAWVWKGSGSRQEEALEAVRVARLMSPYTQAVVMEGNEPIEFWTVLGGQDPYANNLAYASKYRLFAIETSSDGNIEAVEVFDFDQSNLSNRRVAILDAGDIVYVWVGARSKRNAKGKAESLARVYIDSDPTHSEDDKERIKIQTVSQDYEPEEFKSAFPSWREGFWSYDINRFRYKY